MRWADEELGSIALPKAEMRIRSGYGSGLAVRPGDPAGTLWAVCDRGPNLKAAALALRYGVALPAACAAKGAKIMPRLDLGPALAQLCVEGDEARLLRTIRLTDGDGRPVPGVPMAGSPHAEAEPAFDLAGVPIAPDPGGADTEGLVALADGGFWVGDEYGPSLMQFDADGRLMRRLLPGNGLPAIAAKRQINRGFEALACASDERWLFLAFQSPLAHPDVEAHERARHVRIWRLEAETGAVAAQYIYPLDPPESFRRDCAKGLFEPRDIKVSEILWTSEDTLLVLERGSETTKLYRVVLATELELLSEHLEISTRPTLDELSGRGGALALPVLTKELVFSTDDGLEVAADLEGMAWLSATELLLVSDNDFGVEGAETSFWVVRFDSPIADA